MNSLNKKQPVFVTNRVAEIRKLTTADYVQSSHNTADAGTRGHSATPLLHSV